MKDIHILNSLSLEGASIDLLGDEKVAKISGYACHFGVKNKNGEVVYEDSFRKFFDDMGEHGIMPAFTFNHNNDLVIGGWDKITSDGLGLVVEGSIFKDIDIVKNRLLPLLEHGYISSLSTEGFAPYDTCGYDETMDALVMHEFMLTAISLVSVPADFDAQIEMRNSLELLKEKRESAKKENKTRGVKPQSINIIY